MTAGSFSGVGVGRGRAALGSMEALWPASLPCLVP